VSGVVGEPIGRTLVTIAEWDHGVIFVRLYDVLIKIIITLTLNPTALTLLDGRLSFARPGPAHWDSCWTIRLWCLIFISVQETTDGRIIIFWRRPSGRTRSHCELNKFKVLVIEIDDTLQGLSVDIDHVFRSLSWLVLNWCCDNGKMFCTSLVLLRFFFVKGIRFWLWFWLFFCRGKSQFRLGSDSVIITHDSSFCCAWNTRHEGGRMLQKFLGAWQIPAPSTPSTVFRHFAP